ncbi:hypothetical protein M885DRAFT_441112 [Pelagophyceae sp. CCMP2097]|nr:hypothetical protein M885DRAFT_441112 [Pelagophyceae sp. CCMP2097]
MRRRNVTDIVLDVGRRPYAWINNVRMMMGPEDGVLSTCDLERILARTSPLCQDNRGGLVGTLHRVSAIRNRQNDVVGATLRFGRHIAGVAAIVADLLHSSDKSILFVGEPGCGKSTVIRDAACELARRQNVLVVDTSCELGGPADVPHACLGLARRMQVPSLALQASVMVECVQNHTPSVIVVDEIGRPSEVEAARTCKMRGVRIIASAHGDLAGLVRNKELADLVGGVALVTLSDIEARAESRRRGRSSELRKTRPERKTEPIFDIVVELKRDSPHSWRVVLDVARAVDTILVSGRYAVQHRRRSAEGGPIAVSHGTADVPHAQWMSDYF